MAYCFEGLPKEVFNKNNRFIIDFLIFYFYILHSDKQLEEVLNDPINT
jgi:hypothetical protein